MTLPPDIIDRALALIKPKPEQQTACVAMIRDRVEVLRDVCRRVGASPSAVALKKQLKNIADNLKHTRQLLEPSTYAPALLWKTAFGNADSVDESGHANNCQRRRFSVNLIG